MRAWIKRMLLKHRSFILYALFGCINTLIDFLVFTFTNEVIGLAIEYCQVCGYLAGFVSGFVFNRNITFKKESTTGLGTQVFRFVLVNLLSLGVSTLLIRWLEGLGLNDYIAKVAIQIVVVLINYFGYKLFVFKVAKKDKTHKADGESE